MFFGNLHVRNFLQNKVKETTCIGLKTLKRANSSYGIRK